MSGHQPKKTSPSGPGEPPTISGSENNDYEKGYRDGFKDGYEMGKPSTWPYRYPTKKADTPVLCPVCGLDLRNMTLYCCQNAKCPSRVVW